MKASFPCPRCGRALRRSPRGDTPGALAIHCPRCRYFMHDYPRPCVGVMVTRGDQVLVLRRAHTPRKGFLDTPGGFIEAGEGIEVAARRELLEETGLRVGALRWLGFYWDRYYLRGFGWFPTMNFYYVARWRSGEPRAADDAASAEWVPLATLGGRSGRYAWKHMALVVADLKRTRARSSKRRKGAKKP